jgi:hypothetical protein
MSVAALAVGVACASTDTPFSQASLDSIALGTTRYEEVLAMLGTPQRTGVSQVNGQTIDTVSWLHASGKKRRTHRYVSVQFWNGVAVGLLYNSTFEDDTTDFDEAKVAQIVEGHTRVDEVKALLGDPPGRLVYSPCWRHASRKKPATATALPATSWAGRSGDVPGMTCAQRAGHGRSLTAVENAEADTKGPLAPPRSGR